MSDDVSRQRAPGFVYLASQSQRRRELLEAWQESLWLTRDR